MALAACEGLRLGVLEELADGAVLSAVALKDLVSNNRMQVRGLYEGYRETVIGLTPVIATNRRPAIPENTEGVWRRLALVPFTVTVPEERRDPEKAEKLLREAAGILRWMVEGAGLALRRSDLAVPDAVRSATEEYRTEEDVLAAFLDDCCILGPRRQVPCGELYRAYQEWCDRNTGGRGLSQKAFGQALRDRNVATAQRRMDGRKAKVYVGVGLLPDEGTPAPQDPEPGGSRQEEERGTAPEVRLPETEGQTEPFSGTDGTDKGQFSKTFPARAYMGTFLKQASIGSIGSTPAEPAVTDVTDSPPFSETFSAYGCAGDFSKTGLNRFHAPEEPPAAACPPGEGTPQGTAPDAELIAWAREMLEHPERLRPLGTVKEPARFLEANLYDLLHGSGPAATQARERLQDYQAALWAWERAEPLERGPCPECRGRLFWLNSWETNTGNVMCCTCKPVQERVRAQAKFYRAEGGEQR